MLTANEARQFSVDNFKLDEDSVGRAIAKAVDDGQFRVEFNRRRWSDWMDDWLEGLGYEVTRVEGNAVEVSWQ